MRSIKRRTRHCCVVCALASNNLRHVTFICDDRNAQLKAFVAMRARCLGDSVGAMSHLVDCGGKENGFYFAASQLQLIIIAIKNNNNE